jgi:hypothetical protein
MHDAGARVQSRIEIPIVQHWMQPLRQQVENTLSRAHAANIKDLSDEHVPFLVETPLG